MQRDKERKVSMHHLPADHRFEYECDAEIDESHIRYHCYEAVYIIYSHYSSCYLTIMCLFPLI